MTQTIIRIEPGPIFDILGRNGEWWGRDWGDWDEPQVTKTCLHGAIRRCALVKGDAYIVEAVGEVFGFGTDFNDTTGGWDSVRDRIVQGFDITDEMLEETFGPNWKTVVAVVRTIASAEAKQVDALAEAGLAAGAASGALSFDWDTAGDAAYGATLRVGWNLAGAAAGDAAGASWRGVAGNVAHEVGLAVVLRDIVGQDGFAQEHYDRLMAPWLAVFGDPFEPALEA